VRFGKGAVRVEAEGQERDELPSVRRKRSSQGGARHFADDRLDRASTATSRAADGSASGSVRLHGIDPGTASRIARSTARRPRAPQRDVARQLQVQHSPSAPDLDHEEIVDLSHARTARAGRGRGRAGRSSTGSTWTTTSPRQRRQRLLDRVRRRVPWPTGRATAPITTSANTAHGLPHPQPAQLRRLEPSIAARAVSPPRAARGP
jgi:hypothetical protein